MAITVNDMIHFSAAAAMAAYGKKYELGMIKELDDLRAYTAMLRDPVTDKQVPLVWTFEDVKKADTESKKIQLVRDLLVNGADCLSDMIEQDVGYVVEPPDPGEDVVNEG